MAIFGAVALKPSPWETCEKITITFVRFGFLRLPKWNVVPFTRRNAGVL
jgi:hypothetical protein